MHFATLTAPEVMAYYLGGDPARLLERGKVGKYLFGRCINAYRDCVTGRQGMEAHSDLLDSLYVGLGELAEATGTRYTRLKRRRFAYLMLEHLSFRMPTEFWEERPQLRTRKKPTASGAEGQEGTPGETPENGEKRE